MSRRHFEAIAGVLSDAGVPKTGATREENLARAAAVREVAQALARVCARENPAFDAGRFLAASNIERNAKLANA